MNETNLAADSIGKHYDDMSEGWRFIFGENFHFGQFLHPDDTFDRAAENLINGLSGLSTITTTTRILDVGCGIGGPAYYLADKYGCDITGITLSPKGVEMAVNSDHYSKWKDKVRFQVADILADFNSDAAYDIVWIMEVSHLIPNKQLLFHQCYDYLTDNGELLLCDLILKKKLSPNEILHFRQQLHTLGQTFGNAIAITLEDYKTKLIDAGFCDVELHDISQDVFKTMEKWRDQIDRYHSQIAQHMTREEIDRYLESCDILEMFFRNDIFGYGLVKAKKTVNA